MAGTEQRAEAQRRGGSGGMAIGTHAVSGSGEEEGGKRRVGEIWSGPGVMVPSTEG